MSLGPTLLNIFDNLGDKSSVVQTDAGCEKKSEENILESNTTMEEDELMKDPSKGHKATEENGCEKINGDDTENGETQTSEHTECGLNNNHSNMQEAVNNENGNIHVELDSSYQDGKKRPLSVASSSSASTASLQRHQHKKMAGAGALGAPPWISYKHSDNQDVMVTGGSCSPMTSGATSPISHLYNRNTHLQVTDSNSGSHMLNGDTDVCSSVNSSLSPSPYTSPLHQAFPRRAEMCDQHSMGSSGPCSPAHHGSAPYASAEELESESSEQDSSSRPHSTISVDQGSVFLQTGNLNMAIYLICLARILNL